MKIQNKAVIIPQVPQLKDYFSLLTICMDNPPHGGFTPSEMLKRYKITDKLIGESVNFDSGELEKIKEIVKSTPWNFRSKEIIAFSDYIEKL